MNVTACPICENTILSSYLQTRDFSFTGEEFNLDQCSRCTLILTNPRPNDLDLAKYYNFDDYVSHTSTATSLVNRIYLFARHYTIRWKYSLIQKYSTRNTILDYGCGTGHFLQYCQQRSKEVIGVEPSKSARTTASLLLGKEQTFSSIDEVHRNAEIITLWHVLEHVPNLNETLSKLIQRTEPNGTILIAVPNPNSWESKVYREFWAGYDTPRHLWHFTQQSMAELAARNKLKIVDTIAMPLDAYYISLMSEKHRSKTLTPARMMRAAYNGLKSNATARKSTEYSSLIYILQHAN